MSIILICMIGLFVSILRCLWHFWDFSVLDYDIKISPAYRSVSMIVDIPDFDDAMKILSYFDADYYAKSAYCLIPFFKTNKMLLAHGIPYIEKNGYGKSILYIMEFRGIGTDRLSPIKEVNHIIKTIKIIDYLKNNSSSEWIKRFNLSNKIISDIKTILVNN